MIWEIMLTFDIVHGKPYIDMIQLYEGVEKLIYTQKKGKLLRPGMLAAYHCRQHDNPDIYKWYGAVPKITTRFNDSDSLKPRRMDPNIRRLHRR